MNTWDIIEKYPPGIIRCLARVSLGGKRVRAISDDEISLNSKIPLLRIQEIYHMSNWKLVPVGEMEGFIKGCGFDPHNAVQRNRAKSYIRNVKGMKFLYLVNSPWWGSTFKPLIKHMKLNEISFDL